MNKPDPLSYDEWQQGLLTFEQEQLIAAADPEAVPDKIAVNSRYEVWIRYDIMPPSEVGWPQMHHLSIKRRDKECIHDWRDLQRIKNDLIGPEHEAVELYPAESRLVDSANQYHLWVVAEEGQRFPFGYTERVVSEGSHGNSKQRPFAVAPKDAIPDEEMDRRLAKAARRAKRYPEAGFIQFRYKLAKDGDWQYGEASSRSKLRKLLKALNPYTWTEVIDPPIKEVKG